MFFLTITTKFDKLIYIGLPPTPCNEIVVQVVLFIKICSLKEEIVFHWCNINLNPTFVTIYFKQNIFQVQVFLSFLPLIKVEH